MDKARELTKAVTSPYSALASRRSSGDSSSHSSTSAPWRALHSLSFWRRRRVSGSTSRSSSWRALWRSSWKVGLEYRPAAGSIDETVSAPAQEAKTNRKRRKEEKLINFIVCKRESTTVRRGGFFDGIQVVGWQNSRNLAPRTSDYKYILIPRDWDKINNILRFSS